MEVELARRAGLGWRGKHTLMLSRDAGSFFFLGELFTDLPLPPSLPEALPQATNSADTSAVNDEAGGHCGTCTQCLQACPTGAIVAPYQLDARRCISYLTIELKGSIPTALRSAIGNRVYGCDDCQTVCPWNKYAQTATVPDFAPRNGLARASLVTLFGWTRETFERRTEGSAIRRIGHERWSRNLAVALGNSGGGEAERAALRARADDSSPVVREHVQWALAQLTPGPS